MALLANVGPVTFSFVRSTRARMPRFEAAPFGGDPLAPVGLARHESAAFLVIDHRMDASSPSRVEFWRTEDSPEGPLGGLFVLADATAPGPARAFSDLGELVRELGR
jgi:hypothetical protein